MEPTHLTIIYCVIIIAASLLGGLFTSKLKLTHLQTQIVMSLVSGLMLGIAIVHMLPHAAQHAAQYSAQQAAAESALQDADSNPNAYRSINFRPIGLSAIAGIVVMFFLLRVFHVHHHIDPDHSRCDHEHPENEDHEHTHDHDHGGLSHNQPPASPNNFGWLGLFIGLVIHTLIDGVALWASVQTDRSSSTFFGLGAFLAIVLHKPLDAMAITTLLRSSGASIEKQMLVNCGFALACPLGAWFASMGIAGMGGSMALACVLAFSAGFFVCIALGDLLPEIQFHTHDRFALTSALLIGIAVAIVIEMLHTHP